MKEYRIRQDLDRSVVSGFALPLGFTAGKLPPPTQGYSVAYTSGEGDDPDTYTFQIVVSQERLAEVCERCFNLLPPEVFAIVEIGSRDAYRAVDVYIGVDSVPVDHFKAVWKHYERFLLEDGSIAAGANAEEPFIEVFVDQRKTVVVHVPLDMQDHVATMLQGLGLREVPETWPDELMITEDDGPQVRPVLDLTEEDFPDVDELLLQIRESWNLELNIDPDTNVDDAGRELGLTLWHAVVIVEPTDGDGDRGAYMSVWLAATSLTEAENQIRDELEYYPQWTFGVFYTIDRVAHDERPDELANLPPRPTGTTIHLTSFEPWGEPQPEEQG